MRKIEVGLGWGGLGGLGGLRAKHARHARAAVCPRACIHAVGQPWHYSISRGLRLRYEVPRLRAEALQLS